MGGWVERWLKRRRPPLSDIGELFGERRRRSGVAAAVWLVGQMVDFVVQAPRLWRADELEKRPPRVSGVGSRVTDGLLRNVRFALRGLWRHKGWTATVLGTLALGTGAATALFSVSYSVLARPLPYPAPDRLVRLYPADPLRGVSRSAFSMPDGDDWRASSSTVAEMALYTTLPSDLVLTGFGDAVELETAYVTAGFFETLGVGANLGRTLRADEERGDNHVVVLGHGAWTRVFGGDPSVVGSTVQLKAEPYRVVGVMPPGFGFPDPTVEVYAFLTVIPRTSTPWHLRVVRFLEAVGRLEPGVTPPQAREELSAVAAALAERHPESNGRLRGATVQPLRQATVAGVRPALLALLAGSILFLLISCANVAGLFVVRHTARSSEFSVRTSIGAGRGQLLQQLIIEGAVTALLGTGLGLALSWALIRGLVGLGADVVPRASEIVLDGPVFLFAAGVAALVTVLVAVTWAMLLGKRGGDDLRASAVDSPARSRARGALVAMQMTLATVMVIGAGLLVRSLEEMAGVDPGFDPDGRLVAQVNISSTLYPEPSDYMGFYSSFLDELNAIPGVASASSIRHFPTRGVGEQYPWSRPGHEDAVAETRGLASGDRPEPEVWVLQVGPRLGAAMGLRIREGRFLVEEDAGEPFGVVLNESFARLAFGDQSALGQSVVLDDEFQMQVVGVVENVRQRGLGVAPEPTAYVPQGWNPRRSMAFVIHTTGDPLALAGPVRSRLRALDEDQPLAELTTAHQILSESLRRPRLLALLGSAFGLLALGVSVVGAAGTVAYAVGRRTREIGVRVALGERPQAVALRLLRKGFAPVAAGMAFGFLLSLALGRLLRGLLFGVAPTDWPTLCLGLGTLAAAGFIACYLPARRAGAIDPVTAMRAE